ncbi:MAG: hypothetical protein QM768_03265 [Agriterribacter sp.]
MRKILFLAIAVFTLATLPGCKKVWDYVKDHPNGTADNCRIEKIYFTERYVNPQDLEIFIFNDTANFKYNTKGQLTSVDYASTKYGYTVDAFPSINYAFVYDSQGRVLGFAEDGIYYDENTIGGLFLHKYTYINATQVVDSIFTYAKATQFGDDLEVDIKEGREILITLDNWGRIIKYGDTNYSYDASGNLVKPGVTYTSKKSIFQTNKVLMFVARDYSVNTPTGYATQFNSNQLPVKFNSGFLPIFTQQSYPFESQNSESGYENQNVKVEYKCK